MAAAVSRSTSNREHRPSPPNHPAASKQSLRDENVPIEPPPVIAVEDEPPAPLEKVTSASPKRPTFSSRLSRMFKPADNSTTTTAGGLVNKDHAHQDKELLHVDSSTDTSAPTSRRSSATKESYTPKSQQHSGTEERSNSTSDGKRSQQTGSPTCSTRFTLFDDGSHEHFLKADKRQDKLSDMFKNMLGKKKDGQHEDHQLSLVSSWVDQIKNEKVANDQKGGPNCAHTLTEKYGKCQEVVGRGAFGIVRISHKADDKDPRKEQLYAVKEFRRRPSESSKKYNKRLTSEFCISSALRHPNVIHTLDLMKDAKGDFCEVMEYCAGGDLYTLVLAAGKLEVLEADCYFKQLMRGVEYIHEMGVSHRDLKPENLLLTTHGALKITDFGNGECFRMAWEKEAHMVMGLCGSAPYISPEEYIDSEFDPRAVDVWACGVIYMAMRTGRHLWRVAKKDEDEFYERYLEGRRDEDGYGPIETLHRARCRNVIYSILDPNPGRRITASQVLKSEWGREIKLCKAGEEGF